MKISEYVSLGHPDCVCDYISEYILDRLLEQDPDTRYALEVQMKDNYVTLGGEITTKAELAEPCWEIWVKEALAEIGYDDNYAMKWGSENTITPRLVEVVAHISKQSPDIAQGVNKDGWGDQGIFWGMADRTANDDLLPDDYYYAKKLCQHLYEKARNGAPWGLDIKTQVEVGPLGDIRKVIVAAPCYPGNLPELRKEVVDCFHDENFYHDGLDSIEYTINGTGAYIKHASIGDCGTTGRKLVVNFYGGNCQIGGGSPWTKDPTKADLSLNLYARHLAKQWLANHPEQNVVKVSIGCCIGRPEIDVTILDEFGNQLHSYTQVKGPSEVIEELGLKQPMYADMCRKGLH